MGRIVDPEVEHEPVELGFRERICALLFNGVLCRKDEKGLLKRVRLTGGRDTVFLHGLEQRRLSFRGCTVDFIREYDVGEYRPPDKFE